MRACASCGQENPEGFRFCGACGAPLDNLLQMFPLLEVVRKVMAGGGECANVDWTMLGISMPGWVLIAAVCLGLVGIVNNAVYPVRVRR